MYVCGEQVSALADGAVGVRSVARHNAPARDDVCSSSYPRSMDKPVSRNFRKRLHMLARPESRFVRLPPAIIAASADAFLRKLHSY